MRMDTQFSVFLINRPGVLANVTGALAKADISILALSLADSGEHGVLRMVTDDPARTRDVLNEEHDRWTETEVLVGELDNNPGAFAAAAGQLADQSINVSYAYATAPVQSAPTLAVLKPADMAKAKQILSL
jgi:hypothetical protein